MLDTVLKNPWVRAAGVLLVLLAAGSVVYLLLPILTSLFFSFLVAYVLKPVVDFGARFRIPRMATICVLLALLLCIVVFFPLYLVTNIVEEAHMLVTRAGEGISEEGLDQFLDRLPLRDLVHYLGWAPEHEADFNERAVIIEHLGRIIEENALRILRDYGQNLTSLGRDAGRSAAQILASLGRWSQSAVSFLVNLSLFGFVAIYLLRDYEKLMAGLHELVPLRHRPRIDRVMNKIDTQLHSFLRGQVTVCAALAVLYGIGLHFASSPFAIPIALFGGAASIVPYIGPFMTLLPAALMTLLFHGIGGNLFWVFAVFIAVQIIESYFLTPRVLGSHIGLNPVWVVVALMVFGSAFGFLGMVIAVPTAAVLKVLAEEAGAYYRRSAFYLEPAPASASGNPGSDSASESSDSSSSSGTSGIIGS
ncbi:MAG: AI-2E family transporter [Candidatus Hydrogenedentes bacterium]|nr:AI-2E family transporter [Candidatus Hydrogenedentota bacterium]